jgi:hypothetical protein
MLHEVIVVKMLSKNIIITMRQTAEYDGDHTVLFAVLKHK